MTWDRDAGQGSDVFSLARFLKRDDDRALTRAQMLLDFESIGFACEFGLVQRFYGLEPLGLFRFASAPFCHLIPALGEGFAGYGADGDLEVFEGPGSYLFCRSRRYAFCHNTNAPVDRADPAAVLRGEYTKVRYLKERFLADLAAGQRILVRNGEHDLDEMRTLVGALRQHGPATVLWVNHAGDGGPPIGSVRWRADGVIEGFLDRASLYAQSGTVPMPEWLALCANAHALARNSTVAAEPEPADRSAGLPHGSIAHRVGADGSAAVAHVARRLKAGAMHVFSAWVWLPGDAGDSRVALDVRPTYLGFREADLGGRGRWQRIWTSFKPGRHTRDFTLGLRVEGPPGTCVWSAGWRLEEGPLPGLAHPPPAPAPSPPEASRATSP